MAPESAMAEVSGEVRGMASIEGCKVDGKNGSLASLRIDLVHTLLTNSIIPVLFLHHNLFNNYCMLRYA